MFDNILKCTVLSNLICVLTNNVPMGWGIFSVLTLVNWGNIITNNTCILCCSIITTLKRRTGNVTVAQKEKM